jgi:hypothetical protein
MKKLACILFCLLLIFLLFSACSTPTDNNTEEPGPTFIVVESDMLGGYYYKIVYHKDTKVMYVVGHYSDFTVMLNPDGSPMVWEED